jgi:hypothetical protein
MSMILNASAQPPFTEAADQPVRFYELLLTEKSTFKVKQVFDNELSNTNIKCFKILPALADSIWIGDLITDGLTPSNLHKHLVLPQTFSHLCHRK